MKKQAGITFLTVAVGISIVSLPSIFASAQTIEKTNSHTQLVSTTYSSKYAVAGIDNEEEFANYFSKLQKSISNQDKETVAELVHYPFNVNRAEKSWVISNQGDFINNYDQIVTPEVKNALLEQREEDLFSNDQGIMIGNGEAWISKINNKLGIYAINR
ncbi:hypothetical protein JNUCC42_19990 [Brevibacterium sp. JNUCC-42]|nr:hypothetical protein JNUCC42_19990 [Brevibacterium sp. JNUCC-42]